MKIRFIATTIIVLTSVPLNAQESELPSMAIDLAMGVEAGNGEAVLENQIASATFGIVNSELDEVEDEVLSTSNFTSFDLSLGSDSLGLDKSGTKTELITVYRLKETENWFMFNQTSAVNYNSRTTLNTGFGARHINDAETIIAGANVFYDYELQSKHGRNGFGLELLSSIFEFRANQYKALSGTLTYNGVDETALDGSDQKITANLPYFYTSNIYYKLATWKDSTGYKTEHYETGLSAELFPNLTFSVAAQKKDTGKTKYVTSMTFSAPFGGSKQAVKARQSGGWTTSLQPLRDKLYRPVQRENRIMKSVAGAVTVKGY